MANKVRQEVVRVLQEARVTVAKGWCQHRFAQRIGQVNLYWTDDADAYCIAAAVNRAELIHGKGPEAWNLIRRVIGSDPISWQDQPGRTQTEVLGVIDRAIALAAAVSSP